MSPERTPLSCCWTVDDLEFVKFMARNTWRKYGAVVTVVSLVLAFIYLVASLAESGGTKAGKKSVGCISDVVWVWRPSTTLFPAMMDVAGQDVVVLMLGCRVEGNSICCSGRA